MSIRILVVDDHKIVRHGLRALLEKESDMQVAGEACSGRDAIQLARETVPDVIVLDIAMPDMNGIDAARLLLAENPECRILVLSMMGDKRLIIEMFSVGVKGYLMKDCAAEELVRAIRIVNGNEVYVSPPIAGLMIKDLIKLLPEASPETSPQLTSREREVLQLLAEGKNTKEIAFILSVSSKTVDTFRQSIMKKLGLNTVAELTKYAIREKLTTLE
ncbi:MAG TPA: response regulator transcription factor [Geobacteraceae bacterium]